MDSTSNKEKNELPKKDVIIYKQPREYKQIIDSPLTLGAS